MRKIRNSKMIWTCWSSGYWYVEAAIMQATRCTQANQYGTQESDKSLYKPTLESIKDSIKTSTSSMTAVPKPLKFLRPHYEKLEEAYKSWPEGDDKVDTLCWSL